MTGQSVKDRPAEAPGSGRRLWRRGGEGDGGWKPGDRRQLLVVAFSHAVQHSYVAVLGVVYPFALVTFHSNYAVLGIILGVAGIVGGMLQGTAGLIKRLSTRMLLSAQNVGMAAVSTLAALSPGIALFGAARVLGNLTTWPQHPVGSAHVAERLPQRRGFALAVHTTGGNVGTLLAPLAASAVIASFGWRWAIGGAGIVMALGALVTWSYVRGSPTGAALSKGPARGAAASPAAVHGDAVAAAASAPPADTVQAAGLSQASGAPREEEPVSLGKALRRRQAVAVLVAGTISAAGRGLGVLTAYIPAYLHSGLHKPALMVGVLTTVVSVGALAGPVASGHLSDRLGRRPVLYTLYGCGALALAGFVLVGSSPVTLAFVGLAVGIFAYSEQPIRQALFSDAMHGVSARKAFGAYFAISQSVGAIWIALLGVLITTVSFKAAFITMAASFVIAGTIIAVGAREKAPAQPAA